MTTKHFFRTLLIAIVALFGTLQVSAQNTPPKQKSKTPTQSTLEANEQQADEEMAKTLNLTAEQKAAFKKANDEYKAKSKAAKNAKKEELQRLRDERARAHRAVLSGDQLKKYDEIQVKKAAKRHQKEAKKAEHKAEKQQKKAEKKEKKAENKAIKEELKKQ